MANDEDLKAQIAALEAKIDSKRQQDLRQARSLALVALFSAVVINAYETPPTSGPTANGFDPHPPTDFVATHSHQLVKKEALERRHKQVAERRAARRQKLNQHERSQLTQHTFQQGSRELVIDGIRFKLRDDGSKLTRIPDDATTNKQTPKTTKVAGVDFYRTKNGNLIRANAVRTLTRAAQPSSKPQCDHFTKHGKCPYGQSCRFAHDPEQVAICPAFLKNKCPAGDFCDLSHVISMHRVPACHHFLRGNCTNDACRYPHVKVSPSAPVCRPFARLGYCANGDCDKRHIFECPDYANNGSCANKACQLPHIDHAAVLRNAAARQARLSSDNENDATSDEEDGGDNGAAVEDIDSDDAEDVIMADDGGHELSQQYDYVPFQ